MYRASMTEELAVARPLPLLSQVKEMGEDEVLNV